MIRALLSNRAFIIGAVLSTFFIGAAAISYLWTPYDVETLDIRAKLQPASGSLTVNPIRAVEAS